TKINPSLWVSQPQTKVQPANSAPPPPHILDERENPKDTPKILIKNHHIESPASIEHIFLQLKQASCHYQTIKFTYKEKGGKSLCAHAS
ncbi:hypothetical protein, partial [Helicobacter sp. UBA3407]|uniref:hypothetical protein n=1 Tax=Helicobacter sp. UBA3407 TaxID=1946588 RepID=UPI00262D869A